jgi:hypothetical protein
VFGGRGDVPWFKKIQAEDTVKKSTKFSMALNEKRVQSALYYD